MNNFLKLLLAKRDDRCQQKKKQKIRMEKNLNLPMSFFLPYLSGFSFGCRLYRITFLKSLPCPSRISCGKFHRYQNFSHLPSIFSNSFYVDIRLYPNNCTVQVQDSLSTISKSDRLDSDSFRYQLQHEF